MKKIYILVLLLLCAYAKHEYGSIIGVPIADKRFIYLEFEDSDNSAMIKGWFWLE